MAEPMPPWPTPRYMRITFLRYLRSGAFALLVSLALAAAIELGRWLFIEPPPAPYPTTPHAERT